MTGRLLGRYRGHGGLHGRTDCISSQVVLDSRQSQGAGYTWGF